MNQMQINELPEVLSIREVSEILRVSLMTLRRWDNQGLLSAFRPTAAQSRKYRKIDILGFLDLEMKNMTSTLTREAGDRAFDDQKTDGIHFTPDVLAQFVAENIVKNYNFAEKKELQVLDPAIGDGALMLPLLEILKKAGHKASQIQGFDIKEENIESTKRKLENEGYDNNAKIINKDFIEYFLEFSENNQSKFDLIISNPPYVRTQVLGADYAQKLSKTLGLSGRVDLYYAFIEGIARVLTPNGIAGIIVSNKFMKNRSGSEIRRRILENFDILHIWDFGDTKIFEAAVLPCVLILRRKKLGSQTNSIKTRFTSIYSSSPFDDQCINYKNPIEAIEKGGNVKIGSNFFTVQDGLLKYEKSSDIWQLSTDENDTWLKSVKKNTWAHFENVAQIKVGIKTTADNIFISDKWEELEDKPELLLPLTTHKIARQFKSYPKNKAQVLYPHTQKEGKRVTVDLDKYPIAQKYLLKNYDQLNARKYIHDARRKWFEIWVPHDPDFWQQPKVVFRDISKEPTFWIDFDGSVINGDCYWISLKGSFDMSFLWLILAIGNSKFIEKFYDHSFNNKLYAGRRRFMTQYVRKFPLPDPNTDGAKEIIRLSKEIYENIEEQKAQLLKKELDEKIYKIFGL